MIIIQAAREIIVDEREWVALSRPVINTQLHIAYSQILAL